MKFFFYSALLVVFGMAAPIRAQSDTNTTDDDAADGSMSTRSANLVFSLRLRNDNSKCVSFDGRNEYRHYGFIESCNSNSPFQDWYYDNGYIKSYHPDYYDWCLTYDTSHSKRYLRLAKCRGDVTQGWDYSNDDYRFRSEYNTNHCMDYCANCGGYVHAKRCNDAFYYDQEFEVGSAFFPY
jgi:hypothetical protein